MFLLRNDSRSSDNVKAKIANERSKKVICLPKKISSMTKTLHFCAALVSVSIPFEKKIKLLYGDCGLIETFPSFRSWEQPLIAIGSFLFFFFLISLSCDLLLHKNYLILRMKFFRVIFHAK